MIEPIQIGQILRKTGGDGDLQFEKPPPPLPPIIDDTDGLLARDIGLDVVIDCVA